MSPDLKSWEAESVSRPRFNCVRCWLWDGRSISHRVASWGETAEEIYLEPAGEAVTVILEAYSGIAERYRKWLRGAEWCDRNPDHPLQAERVEEAVVRAREFGAMGDELADWLQCSAGELLAVLDWDLKHQGVAL